MQFTTTKTLAILASVATSAAISGNPAFHTHLLNTKSPLHVSSTVTETETVNTRPHVTVFLPAPFINITPSVVTVISTITPVVTSTVALSSTPTAIPTPSGSHIFRGRQKRGLVIPELHPFFSLEDNPIPTQEYPFLIPLQYTVNSDVVASATPDVTETTILLKARQGDY